MTLLITWCQFADLDFTQIEDLREKLFIANFFRVFVKTPNRRIFDLSILENKNCEIDIARTRVIVLYPLYILSKESSFSLGCNILKKKA